MSSIIGLFLYLRTGLFIAVVLLIAGANMPDQIAEGLNISKIPIILALVALVGMAAINYFVKLMPTGLEAKPREKSPVQYSRGQRRAFKSSGGSVPMPQWCSPASWQWK